jgi:hypothetical protein
MTRDRNTKFEDVAACITSLNEGSDNGEYLRGQVELAMSLLDITYDDPQTVALLTRGIK